MRVGSLVTWNDSCRMEPDVGILLETAEIPYEDEEGIVMAYDGALVMWSQAARTEWAHILDVEVVSDPRQAI